jgi:hypothetical protein
MPGLIQSLRDRWWAHTRPRLSRVIYANGGLGDELMLTAIARAAREAGHPVHVLTNLPAIWKNNPDPLSVQCGVEPWSYAKQRGWVKTEIVHLAYINGNGRHIAEQMAEKAGVLLPRDWRPFLPMGAPAERHSQRIVLQNSCRGARYAADTKEWPQERWQELVGRLTPDFELVQIGSSVDPPLPGTRDLRGKTTLHNAAELIAGARCFLGLESGLMHVAAAVGTSAIIIYGGRTRPHETGYAFNHNITRTPDCVGCALNTGCPNGMICMDIPVGEIEAAIHRVLGVSPA